jgi:hypothetical protein
MSAFAAVLRIDAFRLSISARLVEQCLKLCSASPRKASISQIQYPAVSGAELPRFRWLSE